MSLKFQCSVKISDKKFDFVINDLKDMPTFNDIYPNIIEIVRMGTNQVVGYNSHEFFISINSIDSKFRANGFTQTLENNSIITIEPKLLENSWTSVDTSHQQSQTFVERLFEEHTLERCNKDIQLFHSIVMAINIGWDLRETEPNWHRVWQTLDRNYRNSLNVHSTQQHFYFWANYYALNYDRLNNKLVPKHQKIFDLLKVVHILNLDQIYSSNNWNRLEIQKISLTTNSERYFNQCLLQLRQKKVYEKHNYSQRYSQSSYKSFRGYNFLNRNRSGPVRSRSELTNRRNAHSMSLSRNEKSFDRKRASSYHSRFDRRPDRIH